jgi:hypothetical protein
MMCFFQHFICNVWILCHTMFFLLFPFLLFVMFGLKKKKKKAEKWGRGVNCEEEIREKKKKKDEMSEGRCMCVVGEKKKERKK